MATGSYSDAVKSLSKDRLKKLNEALGHWSTASSEGRTIVQNLVELERFLPASQMVALLEAISVAKLERKEITRSYELACHSTVGQGGAAKVPGRVVLGRAVNRAVLVSWLFHAGRTYFSNLPRVEQFVDRWLGKEKLTKYQERLPMSKYLAWATFDAANPSEPFSFLKYGHADEVRAHLGLDPKLPDRLILLTYSEQAAKRLLRPTVADAGTYLYFRPPPPACNSYGMTVPWAISQLKPPLCELLDLIPRPEILHSPVKLKDIFTIKELA